MNLLATGCSGGVGRYIRPDFEIDFRNFRSNDSLSNLETLSNGSTLIHLAAITSIRQVQDNPDESFKVNVSSTVDLFRAFAKNGGKRFIFTSTGHVYGKTPAGCLSTELDPLNPLSLYAEQKILAEGELLRAAENSGVELIVFRVFSIFGLGMRSHFLAGQVEATSKNLNDLPKILNADDVRDFSSPSDIAYQIEKSAKIPMASSLTLNLCTGRGTTVREIVMSKFPSTKKESFVAGNSETPRLVGDPRKKHDFFKSY
jgi:nucleoside-diphosphate-sugar epimerase